MIRVIRWLLFVCIVPVLAAGIGLYCAWLALLQGIECAAEVLDE